MRFIKFGVIALALGVNALPGKVNRRASSVGDASTVPTSTKNGANGQTGTANAGPSAVVDIFRNMQEKKAESSQKNEPASSTQSSSPKPSESSSSSNEDPDIMILCDSNGKNMSTWESFNMADRLKYLLNDIPKDNEKSFTEYVASLVKGLYSFDCPIGDACHDADLDYDSCMKGGKKTAELYFILYVTRNFHDWIDQIFGSIDSARSHFSSRSTELTTKFTTHDLPENNSWIATLITGILAATSAIIAPFALGAAAGSTAAAVVAGGTSSTGGGGGISVMGASIAQGALKSAAGIVQNELNNQADLEHAISNGLDIIYDATWAWGVGAINDPAHNNPDNHYWYYQNQSSAYAVLEGGAFSNAASAKVSKELDDSLIKAFYGAAISTLWAAESVFIVKVSRPLAYDADPCDFKLDSHIFRHCDDGTAWFFIKSSDTYATHDYPSVPGVDDVGDFGLEMFDLAKSAFWTQEKMGYKRDWETQWIADTLTSKEPPPSGIMVSIPVCDLDELYDQWPEDIKYTNLISCGSADCLFKMLVKNTCTKQTLTINDEDQEWPIEW